MGRKDITGREYFSDRERFAELFNSHFCHGQKMLKMENLVSCERKYPSLASASGEIERDILMEDTVRAFCFGMELETESDDTMPERVMVYDACEYERQVREIYRGHEKNGGFQDYREKKSRIKPTDFLKPVVTVVVYLGEGHWGSRRCLSELFRVTEPDKELFSAGLHGYGFLLVEADFVNPEDYKTDLRQFFQAMQCRKDRKKLRGLLKSETFKDLSPETELAIAAYLNVKKLMHKMKKEGLPMCKAFDDLMKEERQNGRREGEKEGKRKGKKEERMAIVARMYKKGIKESVIREVTGCTKKELAAVAGQ